MCKTAHCFTEVPFAFNMKKFLSLEIFYTHAVTDVTDNYEVCSSPGSMDSGHLGGDLSDLFCDKQENFQSHIIA